MKCKSCGRYLKKQHISWDAVGVIAALAVIFGWGAYIQYVHPMIERLK